MSYDKILAMRPQNVLARMGSSSKICPTNSKIILNALKDDPVIVMACNIRIKHVVPGIMRAAEELDAIVGFELARSEGNLKGGYTGMTPDLFVEMLLDYAEQINFSKPFFIHADHITIKRTEDYVVDATRDLIAGQLKAGFTSFAIDASFNELPINIELTTELAKPIIAADFGLEVEVGEVKSAGMEAELSTIEEATEFITALNSNNVHPQLLAINNGSKHGNYGADEEVSIDLIRTREIYEAIKPYGVTIAQHGITGTPLSLVGTFADHGIRKGNVGTTWQNVAHAGLPQELMQEMKDWAASTGNNVKMATKEFKTRIDNIGQSFKDAIEEESYKTASDFFKAFRSVGTASKVVDSL